jgi:hypothetical protein
MTVISLPDELNDPPLNRLIFDDSGWSSLSTDRF